MITILDIISSTVLFVTIILLFVESIRYKQKSKVMLFIAFGFLFISTVFNIPEHLKITETYNIVEVLFEILFLPTLILSIHISKIDKELVKQRNSEKKYRAIFNLSFSLVGLIDKNENVLEVNEKSLKMVGKDIEEVREVPFSETPWWKHSKEEQKKLKEAFILASKGKIARFETTHIDSNNNMKIIDFSLKPVFNDAKELLYYIAEGRDITLIKQIQYELETHKNKLEVLVKEKTEDLETAIEELRATNDELFNKNIIINSQNEELRITLKHLRETQLQLIEAEKMASLGVLTAGVAHEINNPLNFIMGGYVGLSRYFKNKEDVSEKYIPRFLSSIKKGVDRASKIVKGLSLYSQFNKSNNDDCDIHNIIDNCILMLHHRFKQKIIIDKRYNSKQQIIVGNIGKLHQAFINLLTNAKQAIKDKGTIIISTHSDSDNLYVEVSDDGCGISEDSLKRITDPFFTTKSPGEGPGLGLSITYSIISKHNGSMSFESEPGKGTIVKIILPIKKLEN